MFLCKYDHPALQPPADAVENLSCQPSNFRKRVRKVINEVRIEQW
jgi:hypothetical protein